MIDLGLWAGEDYRVAGGKIEDREHPDDRRANGRPHTRDSND
jgi:endogenous inhibitor of DNA gyrase (YacG/DUF329 family)